MDWKTISTIVAVIGSVAAVFLYLDKYAEKSELIALAADVSQNSDQLTYQSLERQREYLLKKDAEKPNDPDTKKMLRDVEKKLKVYDCKLFKDCNGAPRE